jgi:hypothetical protein
MSTTTKPESTPPRYSTRDVANAALADVIRWCGEHRGSIGWMCTQVFVDYGIKVARPQMSRYLAQNPEKRVEPQLGIGLAIIASHYRLRQGKENHENERTH